MSGEVNRVPQGLLSLLDMQARGNNPRRITDVLDVGFDATQLYLQPLRVRKGAAATAAVGSQPSFTVPQNELWWIHWAGASVNTIAAGTTIQMRFHARIVPEGGGSGQVMALGDPSEVATTGQQCLCYAQGPFIALPGDILGPCVTQLVLGVAPSIISTVDCTVIRI